jgi:hypothetical protein
MATPPELDITSGAYKLWEKANDRVISTYLIALKD